MTDLGDQLLKALGEIKTAIENSGNVSQELTDAVNGMETAINEGMAGPKATAQELDNLNPDQPPQP